MITMIEPAINRYKMAKTMEGMNRQLEQHRASSYDVATSGADTTSAPSVCGLSRSTLPNESDPVDTPQIPMYAGRVSDGV